MNRFKVSQKSDVARTAQSLWIELRERGEVEISAIGLGATHNMVKAVATLSAFCAPIPTSTLRWEQLDATNGDVMSGLVIHIQLPENAKSLLPPKR